MRCSLVLGIHILVLLLAGCGGGSDNKTIDAQPLDTDGDRTADASDCAPNDASRWRVLQFASVDADDDGHRTNSSGELCSGETLPARYFADLVAVNPDCNDSDPAQWQILAFAGEDRDGDGHFVHRNGELCGQDTLPANLSTAAPTQLTLDCDDGAADAWRVMAIYADRDGDGSGSGAPRRECMGTALRSGYVLAGDDPLDDPNDPLATSVSTAPLSWAVLTPPDDSDDDDIF